MLRWLWRVTLRAAAAKALIRGRDTVLGTHRMLPTKRSAMALARGARTGVLMMRTSMAVKTASNAAVNLASRSRMRNRKRLPASSRSMSRLRTCWVSQALVGWTRLPPLRRRR